MPLLFALFTLSSIRDTEQVGACSYELMGLAGPTAAGRVGGAMAAVAPAPSCPVTLRLCGVEEGEPLDLERISLTIMFLTHHYLGLHSC